MFEDAAAGSSCGPSGPEPAVEVYWRPGCGYCWSLIRGLERHGLRFVQRNIWEEAAAGAFVRSVANGNETVPTVRVGDLALVNPSAHEVLAAVARELPALLPTGYEPPEPGVVARLVTRLLGG